jgi:hypothetical protein
MRINAAVVAVLVALACAPAAAQEQVTVVTRDNTRFTGRFEAWNRPNNRIYVRVSQNDQRIVPLTDVLMFEVGGDAQNLPAAETEAARGTDHVLVLTSGEVLRGRLLNIEGGEGSDTPNEPRVVSFRPTAGAERRARMNEVRRLYFGNFPAATVEEPVPAGAVRVGATAGWVGTGVYLTKGDSVQFQATGEVRLSADAEDRASTAGSLRGRYAARAPAPQILAGALIGRVGTSGQPFGIGNMTQALPMDGVGELFLAVNDDELGDNQGAFVVTVRVIKGR